MIDRYRHWYEQECDSNDKMLSMLESVPGHRRDDSHFSKAVNLPGHLAACRENWLSRMAGEPATSDWWPQGFDVAELRPRFAKLQEAWTSYLESLSDEDLGRSFEFTTRDGKRYRWGIEGQLVQLVGHAFYHRGQIALLVEGLGGETVDTDYLY